MKLFKIIFIFLLPLALLQISFRQQPIEPVNNVNLSKTENWKVKILKKIDIKKSKKIAKPQNYQIRTQMSAFLLCLFFGFLGVHRFYTGHYLIGFLQLFTFGCCGLFWIVDLIFIVLNKLPTAWGDELVSWDDMLKESSNQNPLSAD